MVTLLASGGYLSFLLRIDWDRFVIEAPERRELALRVIFLAVAGNLTNTLAEAMRRQFAKTKAMADQLAEANRNLQQAEEAVRRSDRLAALGQLAAGLAHELRNPLGTIRASAEMLNRSVAKENEVAREVAGFIASRKWTAPIRWSRASWISCAPSNCGLRRRTWPRCSIAPSPW